MFFNILAPILAHCFLEATEKPTWRPFPVYFLDSKSKMNDQTFLDFTKIWSIMMVTKIHIENQYNGLNQEKT